MWYQISKNKCSFSKHYQHVIMFHKNESTTGMLDFDRCRRWFVSNFDWAQEIESIANILPCHDQNQNINFVWAYSVKYSNCNIYVDNDKTLSWFLLCNPVTP